MDGDIVSNETNIFSLNNWLLLSSLLLTFLSTFLSLSRYLTCVSTSVCWSTYLDSKLSIIPLKDSYQPAGQSVALQSMSLGIPVMITKTIGFWQKNLFINNENIIFVDDFQYKTWIQKINEIFYDDLKIKKISKNAKETILNNYKLEKFYNFLNQLTKNI